MGYNLSSEVLVLREKNEITGVTERLSVSYLQLILLFTNNGLKTCKVLFSVGYVFMLKFIILNKPSDLFSDLDISQNQFV